jgi:hypothetical protein
VCTPLEKRSDDLGSEGWKVTERETLKREQASAEL